MSVSGWQCAVPRPVQPIGTAMQWKHYLAGQEELAALRHGQFIARQSQSNLFTWPSLVVVMTVVAPDADLTVYCAVF